MKLLANRLVLTATALLALGACTLPRGGPVQSEVLRTETDAQRDIMVMSVTKANLPDLSRWPATGGGSLGWIDRQPGAGSALISAGDMIDLTIWDNDENSLLTNPTQKVVDIRGLPISASGTVFIPYLDHVMLSGLTHEQARELIQSQLGAILPAAQVQLAITPGRRNSVEIVGGVISSGSVPLPDRSFSVLSLLSQSGGVQPGLRNPQIKLVRGNAIYGISVERLFSDPQYDATLRGGDKVIIEDDKRYFLSLGAAGEEDLQYFTKDSISALDAVSLIGGVADATANPQGILILREYASSTLRYDGTGPDRERVVFTLDLTTSDGLFSARRFTIQPKDLVLVSESPLNSVRTVLGLISQTIGLSRATGI